MMLSHGGAGVVNATFCAGIPAAPGPQMASILEALRISVFICQDEPVLLWAAKTLQGPIVYWSLR